MSGTIHKAAATLAALIKQLREANNVSQGVFARYLNTSESTVEKWESGAKRPSPTLRKPLSVVQKHGLQVHSLAPSIAMASGARPGASRRAGEGGWRR